MVKAATLFAIVGVAGADKVKLSFTDCGSSSTHGKINSLSPDTIDVPGKATIVGAGALDADQTSASFSLKVKKGLIPLVSGKGSLCEDTTINVPLGAGSFTVKGIDCPAKAGDVQVQVDLDILSDLIEDGENDLLDIHIEANADDTGDQVLCLDIAANQGSDIKSKDICSLYEIADDSCGQSDLNCDYVKYAKAAEKALQDGTCADQGYSVQTGTQTKSYPVIGDIVITTYSKGFEASCSGTADPAGPACYEGSAGALGLTETVKVNLLEVSAGAGKLEFSGSGIEGFTCSEKTYTKSGTDVALSDLSDCLPDHVEVTKVQYCSDDDTMKVTVKDDQVPLPVSATLKKVACASNDVFASCTGDADPVITGATCYKGSAGALGLTETVTVKINDYANGAGHVDFSGEGIESFSCNGKTFTKSAQDITFSDSSDCLPSGIVVSGVKYCSDSDTMKITVKDETVPLPISAIASKIDCPSTMEV